MLKSFVFGFFAALILVSCTDVNSAGNLPEDIAALAAPNQNLSTARLLPEDGCYWYSHQGPVETTLLPLRTREGRPICTRPQI